jgi:cytochrome d ubiquinol oxidase subunit I
VVTPFQIVAGDYAARFVAQYQPAKLAAIEGVYHTGSHIPLTVGGIAADGQLDYGVKIPDGLSPLVGSDPNTVITGLDRVPRDLPPGRTSGAAHGTCSPAATTVSGGESNTASGRSGRPTTCG